MKTLKFISFAVLAIVMSINFAACSNDDDKNGDNPENVASNLEGTWGMTKDEGWYQNELGEKETYTDTYDPSNPTEDCVKLEVKKSGDTTYSLVGYTWTSGHRASEGTLIYDTKTKKLTNPSISDYTGIIVSLNATTLVIKRSDTAGSYESTSTFRRMN